MSSYRKDPSNMGCLDIYLSLLDQPEREKIKHLAAPRKHREHPLMSWDIFCLYGSGMTGHPEEENDLDVLRWFQRKFRWQTDLDKILAAGYQALVLTDSQQHIQWASAGFLAMTGFSREFATGRSPRFLQGENTSGETLHRIRQQLLLHKPFTETITNYRKNGEEYLCQVTIFPVKNNKGQLTHFLALEKEIHDSRRQDTGIGNADI